MADPAPRPRRTADCVWSHSQSAPQPGRSRARGTAPPYIRSWCVGEVARLEFFFYRKVLTHGTTDFTPNPPTLACTREGMRRACAPLRPRRRPIATPNLKRNVWRRWRGSANFESTSSPASTQGWGDVFGSGVPADAVVALAPPSAAAQLFSRGISIGFDGHESVTIPSYLASANAAGKFVAENAPIPVAQLSVTEGVVSAIQVGGNHFVYPRSRAAHFT